MWVFLINILQLFETFVSNANCERSFSVLSFSMLQDNTNRKLAEGIQDGDRRDGISDSAHKETATDDTRIDLGLLLKKTMGESRCEGMMGVRCFDAMVVDGRNCVIYDKFNFERDTALGAWKRRSVVLSIRCAGICVDTRFVEMPFVRCKQELGATDASCETLSTQTWK